MKLNIRLPDDDGPNPYDSKTRLEDLPKNQVWTYSFWIGLAVMCTVGYFVRQWLIG